jgi:hypothetical protein
MSVLKPGDQVVIRPYWLTTTVLGMGQHSLTKQRCVATVLEQISTEEIIEGAMKQHPEVVVAYRSTLADERAWAVQVPGNPDRLLGFESQFEPLQGWPSYARD